MRCVPGLWALTLETGPKSVLPAVGTKHRALVRRPRPQVPDEGPRLRHCCFIYKAKAARTSQVLMGIKEE